jgi:hypothetical protein
VLVDVQERPSLAVLDLVRVYGLDLTMRWIEVPPQRGECGLRRVLHGRLDSFRHDLDPCLPLFLDWIFSALCSWSDPDFCCMNAQIRIFGYQNMFSTKSISFRIWFPV